ncbi:MAG: hypothetical protein NW220_09860, partial [Leptolyngbyaceae cyanobacterium bins.349]|nr:hypothetical protein [Leptolyngbyaceae cyanobacterium bins.349]
GFKGGLRLEFGTVLFSLHRFYHSVFSLTHCAAVLSYCFVQFMGDIIGIRFSSLVLAAIYLPKPHLLLVMQAPVVEHNQSPSLTLPDHIPH